jgi:hypothetical protein
MSEVTDMPIALCIHELKCYPVPYKYVQLLCVNLKYISIKIE